MKAVGHLIREICESLFEWDAFVFSVTHRGGTSNFSAVLLLDTIDGNKVECEKDDFNPPDKSAIWSYVLQGKPYLLNRTENERQELLGVFGNHAKRSESLIFVPVKSGDRVSGLICIQSYIPEKFDNDDCELLMQIADLVGPTLLRCQAERSMRQFLKLGEQLNQATDTAGVARVVYHAAAKLLGWDYISIHLYQPITHSLHLVLGLERSHEICRIYPSSEHPMPSHDGLIHDVLEGRSIHLTTQSMSAEDKTQFLPFGQSLPLLNSIILAPIRSMNQIVGVLCVQSEKTGGYGTSEADIAGALADYCSGALERAWALQNLQQSEEDYKLLVENVNDGIVISQNEKFVYFNNRFAAMLGYTDDELNFLNYHNVYTPTGLEILRQRETFREAGVVVPDRYETVFKRQNGELISVEANVRIIPDYHGRAATFAVIRDTSERKAAEQKVRSSEQELRTLFNAMTDIILVLDSNGNYQGRGHGGEDFVFTPWELDSGKSLFDVFSQEKAAYLVRLVQRSLKTRQTINIEFDRQDAREINHWYNATFSPLSDDRILVVARDVTERRRAEEELFRSNARYEALLDGSEDYIFVLDRELRFVHVNSVLEKRYGARVEDRIGKTLADVYGDITPARFVNLIKDVFKTGQSVTYDDDAIIKGQTMFTETVISPVFSRLGEVEAILGISRDVTNRRQSALALKQSEERYAVAVRGANDGIWDWNLISDGIYLSPRWWEILGEKGKYANEECDPERWFERVHIDDLVNLRKKIASHLSGETPYFEDEHRISHLNGKWRWVLCRGLCVSDNKNIPQRMAGSMTDITDRKNAEAKLHYGATHDALTDLPNRAYFITNLRRTMQAQREKKSDRIHYALLFLDLDRFKVVNDSLGHLAGDELIVATARRIENCVRPGDIVARMGGDEFTVLLEKVSSQSEVVHVAKRILQELAIPVEVKGFRVQTTVSMGISFYREDYTEPEDLLRDADTAMYRAKATGSNRYQIFDKQMHAAAMEQLKWEAELQQAVARQEFVMYYQPIIRLSDQHIAGFEALVRWNHPRFGFVLPGDFIAIAEETGLIINMGWWIMEQALCAVVKWNRLLPSDNQLTVSVNLSPRQFMQPNLVEQVEALIIKCGTKPENLILEITENLLMDDSSNVIEDIRNLRAIGIKLDLDDFGTGYSSLSFLRRFHLDNLKIDRTFIENLSSDKASQNIVNAMLTLASALSMMVTAEGVETEEQMNALKAMECHYAQGYYFNKPMTFENTLKLLEQNNKEVIEQD